MAKSKNLPPLTEYHQKHLDNFRDARKIGEIEAFDFTIQHLQHYTAILSTCLHVKELYQRLSRNLTERTANAQIETGRLRVVKSERRAVAPQLLMGLRDLAIAMANLELEHRKERSVVDSQRLVIAERNKYREYEPVFSLYLPYMRECNFMGGEGNVQDAWKTRGKFQELLLARDTVLFPLGADLMAVFRNLNHLAYPDNERQTAAELKKVNRARGKLEEGLEEWRAIARHIETLKTWKTESEGDQQYFAILKEVVDEVRLTAHIVELSKHLAIADDLLSAIVEPVSA